MTRTPTAEEVLKLYGEFIDATQAWINSDFNDDNAKERRTTAIKAWVQAFEQWQASQGPYTFEWFCGRFGEYVHCNLGSLFAFIDGVELEIKGQSVFFDHPQRADVEALVRLLNGKDGE